jgi:hypothetical protein
MAIRYGYSEVKDEKPGMPHPDLVALADLNLPFATDEDDSSENGPDPSVSVFDFTCVHQHKSNVHTPSCVPGWT